MLIIGFWPHSLCSSFWPLLPRCFLVHPLPHYLYVTRELRSSWILCSIHRCQPSWLGNPSPLRLMCTWQKVEGLSHTRGCSLLRFPQTLDAFITGHHSVIDIGESWRMTLCSFLSFFSSLLHNAQDQKGAVC